MTYSNIILSSEHPTLRRQAVEVARPWFGAPLMRLATHMITVMRNAGGIGLAAPQIGVLLRVVVVVRADKAYVYVNPVVTQISGELMGNWEACLSVPGKHGWVRRRETVDLMYYDVLGEHRRETLTGWDATVIQHEIDHLDGVLYIDRASSVRDNE